MATAAQRVEAPVERLTVAAYTVPTDSPESDGTLEWNSTTLVVVHVGAAGKRGLGYTYAHAAAAALVNDMLRAVVVGHDAFAIPSVWEALGRRVRNVGRPGIAATAISAVDAALWDLKARGAWWRHVQRRAGAAARNAGATPSSTSTAVSAPRPAAAASKPARTRWECSRRRPSSPPSAGGEALPPADGESDVSTG